MRKVMFLTMLLLVVPVAFAQASDVSPGVLPSNRFLHFFDRLFDNVQHFGNKSAIAQERLAELREEITRGNPEGADLAREQLRELPEQAQKSVEEEVEEEEKRFNEKFDFDLEEIKDKINADLEANNQFIPDKDAYIVEVIGNRPRFLEVIVVDGRIMSIAELQPGERIDLSMDNFPRPDLTLSHGEIFASLQTDASYNALKRKIVRQFGSRAVANRVRR